MMTKKREKKKGSSFHLGEKKEDHKKGRRGKTFLLYQG